MLDRQTVIPLVLGLCAFNGIFSPYLKIAIPITAALMPELFPRTLEWVLFWSSVLLATATLLFSGVPAALYERLVEHDPNGAASTWIWLGGAGALSLPAVLRFL
jgi:heme/copper-type cytochrome/quinol oxidase subunit 3